MSFIAVADTHTILWYLYGDPRLSAIAKSFIQTAVRNGSKVAVSSISLVEIGYLVEKGRILSTAFEDVTSTLTDPSQTFEEAPVSRWVADSLRQVSRLSVPDMPDRIIAATGLHFAVPVISRDSKIRAANIQTIR